MRDQTKRERCIKDLRNKKNTKINISKTIYNKMENFTRNLEYTFYHSYENSKAATIRLENSIGIFKTGLRTKQKRVENRL